VSEYEITPLEHFFIPRIIILYQERDRGGEREREREREKEMGYSVCDVRTTRILILL
jgi:hypothetical protein